MDFKTKELVGVYDYSNVNEYREYVKSVSINGRPYLKKGTATATTVVAFQYKVSDPSVERSEYITLIGVARQNPGDVNLDKETGYEIAAENALLSPVAVLKYNHKCKADTIDVFMRTYVTGQEIQFVKTKEELKLDGADISKYTRNTRVDNDYYNDYYNDYKKMFMNK